jgi:hypothetical protein
MRDAVLVVDQPETGTTGLLLVRLADRSEVLGEEEIVDVLGRDVAAQRCQRVVERQLVG